MTDGLTDAGDRSGDPYSDLDLAKYCSIQQANTTLGGARTGDLTIMYINIKSLYFNEDEFHGLLGKLDKTPDLICLSETKITEKVHTDFHPHLENYKYYGIKSKTHFGSVGVFIRDNLVYSRRHDLDCSEKGLFEMFWLNISPVNSNSAPSTIGIIYRHCGDTSIPSFTRRMEKIIHKLIREKVNYYIMGDFNCNLLKIDEKPNISDFVNSMHSLNSANLVNIPTRFPIGNQPGSPSILDHLWTNIPNRVKNIELIVNPISDHRPTIFIFDTRKKVVNCKQVSYPIRDMKHFDAEAFNQSLSNFQRNSSNIHHNFVDLQNHIMNCINLHAPLRERTLKEKKFQDKPWITNSMVTSMSNRDRLYTYLQNHYDPTLQRKYNKIKKTLKKVIFAAKCKFFQNKFSLYQNNSKRTWRTINEVTSRKKRDKKTIQTIKMANGQCTSDAKIIANTLNDYFVNIGVNMSNQLPPAPLSHEHFLKRRQTRSFFLHPTDPGEILKIIDSFSAYKSPGPDKIASKFLKIGAPALSIILSILINDCFSQGVFPNSLKIARVVAIFKEGLPDLCLNYRPISIISVLSKLIEKLTYKRLVKYLDKFSILNNSQFGFRSGHSTTHAIASIHERILENINSNKHTISIYLDLSKAFDSVDHTILLNKLSHYGIRGVSLQFFKSYLSDRQQFTVVNGEISNILSIICGVPQGSTLGPLLFLLYINDLATASKFIVSLFADDTCLLLSHENLATLENTCNAELIHINNWFLANKLTANRTKASKFMLTMGKIKMKQPESFNLYMGNTTLEKVKKVKYLGVIFDDGFKWDDHVSYICKKISQAVGVLSKLRYYVDIKTLIEVYHSLVNSHLSYALMVWGAAGTTALSPIRILQNRAIRFISRASRYRRLDLDYINLRILKLDDMYQHSVIKFMHQYHNGQLPNHFSNFFITPTINNRYNLRRANISDYCPIHCNKNLMHRSIRYVGPNAWTNLPLNIRNLKPAKLNKELKNHLLAQY